MRIAIGSIFIECNHFGGVPADLETFARCELRRGAEVLDQEEGTVGGMLDQLRRRSCDTRPLVVATACPSGLVTADCYAHLRNEMLDRLSAAGDVDGVLLALHGSAAVSDEPGDLEGDLLEAVRERVGRGVPVVGTLDLHAHVTAQMVENADALLAWETYPHRDAFETGTRGARMLFDILDGKSRPAMALSKVPVLVGGAMGHTDGEGPFADVMRFAKAEEGRDGVLSTSVFLVHPYLDLPDMGGGGLVITDDNLDRAVELSREIARQYWERRFDLEPPVAMPSEAIRNGLQIEGGPVLLVEASDCVGGGASGDSVATLRALLDAGVTGSCVVAVVDPEVAAVCHRHGVGARIDVAIGHSLDPQWGEPLAVSGSVTRLGDGRFVYSGGIWDGRQGDMGPSAVLEIDAIQVLVTTHPTYDWADEQYSSMGLDIRGAKFVVVKNPMNYRISYRPVSRGEFLLDTPGPTPATLRNRLHRNLERPYFPMDEDIAELEIRTVTSVFSATRGGRIRERLASIRSRAGAGLRSFSTSRRIHRPRP